MYYFFFKFLNFLFTFTVFEKLFSSIGAVFSHFFQNKIQFRNHGLQTPDKSFFSNIWANFGRSAEKTVMYLGYFW